MEPYYKDDWVTIYHGDCREILPTIGYFDLLLTDPPYGIDLGNHQGAKETRSGLLIKRGGYDDSQNIFSENVVPAIEMSLSICKRGMVFCIPPSMWKFPPPNAIGGVFVAGAVGRNCWGWSTLIHLLLYGTAPKLEMGAKPTAIASNEIAQKNGHPTPKPLGWIRWAITLGSVEGDTILDPFAGSGTTGRAAKDLGRKAVLIEIDEKYCEIAAKRLSQEVLNFAG